jgi:hypothetical protein
MQVFLSIFNYAFFFQLTKRHDAIIKRDKQALHCFGPGGAFRHLYENNPDTAANEIKKLPKKVNIKHLFRVSLIRDEF